MTKKVGCAEDVRKCGLNEEPKDGETRFNKKKSLGHCPRPIRPCAIEKVVSGCVNTQHKTFPESVQ